MTNAVVVLGNDVTSFLIACNACGTIGVEYLARHSGWQMWVEHRVRYHHCSTCVGKLLAHFPYVTEWEKWEWAS